jgi:hypothetical protein
MSITTSDLKYYGSANMDEADGSTQGGAIDTTTVVVFDDSTLANTLNTAVKVVSDNAGDTTQTVTVYGRSASGSIVSEALSLNGTTVVTGSTTFERILKAVVSASHSGNISLKKSSDNTVFATLASGELTIRRPFYNVSADVSGGSSRVYYEKLFLKNNHGSLAFLNCTISEQADPSGKITFAVAAAVNDSVTSTNRQTAPATITFDSSSKTIPGTDLASGSKIGIWLALTLAAGDAATKTTYTLRAAGSTT